jgi:hypothetical protein
MLFTLSAWMAVPGPSVPLGILCPVCRTDKHKIVRTFKVVGMVNRERLCVNQHRFETSEVVKP